MSGYGDISIHAYIWKTKVMSFAWLCIFLTHHLVHIANQTVYDTIYLYSLLTGKYTIDINYEGDSFIVSEYDEWLISSPHTTWKTTDEGESHIHS
jgi:hypothetical protein